MKHKLNYCYQDGKQAVRIDLFIPSGNPSSEYDWIRGSGIIKGMKHFDVPYAGYTICTHCYSTFNMFVSRRTKCTHCKEWMTHRKIELAVIQLREPQGLEKFLKTGV